MRNMEAKNHPLSMWIKSKRLTKTALATAMNIEPSNITRHTQGKFVTYQMVLLYEAEGVPKSIINIMKKQRG